ncbi:MAG: efflux RND transporter periplasmic adaptor subunit, partial [Planctomycetaceae bacterium]|nr:efflux RND transporter periplasmic adaptor subunit [Planctomycetaceae bacterium]
MSFALVVAAGLIVIAALGLAQRMGWIAAGGAAAASTAGAAADQIYTCPMHPQIRQPGPGRCPICGMELVPATSSGGADLDELSVKIEPAQRRLANIQTAAVERRPVMASVQTIGEIAIDESRMSTIASYIDGRLERLFADYTGVVVAEGDHLAVIYSPELYAAQVELLETRKTIAEMTPGTLPIVRQTEEKLVRNLRQRLVELGMTDEQIAELEQTEQAKSRLTIFTPIGGTVIEKLAVEGKYVKVGEPIYRVANLSTVWLMLELFPEDAARIRFGQRVQSEIQSLPGEAFEGRVAFVDPTVDEQNRTVGVRVELLNDAGRLRPGDYAKATIQLPIGETGEVYDADLAGKWISPMHPQIIRDEPGKCPICGMDLVSTSRYGYADQPVEQPASLYVPRAAVLMAGSSSVVYVETEPGHFEIRPVTLGPILRDRIIVLEGLKEGEQVATAGNFLIDSQMQLAGKPSLIDPTRAITKHKERNEPLQFEHIHVTPIAGAAGQKLEQLYATYFNVQ